ncbi:aminotransferase [Syncephalastrum racemosum]|uniref:Aminotransferase n=1 Tax=Syncephalastrum racemosum TaxID=13706 RepID=A0A1X2HWC4_SYNRA|nr:aminotransferase [Syncephalastrum racemosum]
MLLPRPPLLLPLLKRPQGPLLTNNKHLRLYYRLHHSYHPMANLTVELPSNSSSSPLVNDTDTDSNQFILQQPRGAYTGMRTLDRTSIVAFSSHVKRLTTSLSLMTFPANGAESADITDQLAPFRDTDSLTHSLKDLLRIGLQTFRQRYPEYEAKVSVLIAYDFKINTPRCWAHFSPLHAPPPDAYVHVVAEEKARATPVVKDSQWVRDRAGLERAKPTEINEVVLTDADGHIYEGMASNFFAVCANPTRLVCAPLDHILLGTVMKIVMTVCEQKKIPIEWVFPKLSDARAGTWEGCFLTSTSRLLLPIEAIHVKDGSPVTFTKHSETIEMLRQEVRKAIYQDATQIL